MNTLKSMAAVAVVLECSLFGIPLLVVRFLELQLFVVSWFVTGIPAVHICMLIFLVQVALALPGFAKLHTWSWDEVERLLS